MSNTLPFSRQKLHKKHRSDPSEAKELQRMLENKKKTVIGCPPCSRRKFLRSWNSSAAAVSGCQAAQLSDGPVRRWTLVSPPAKFRLPALSSPLVFLGINDRARLQRWDEKSDAATSAHINAEHCSLRQRVRYRWGFVQ